MKETLEKIAEYLSNTLDGVKVKTAYDSRFLKRPVITPAVYLTVNDTDSGSAVSFIAYAYSPISGGGIGCIGLAENAVHKLQLCDEAVVCGLTVGKVSFNSNSNAFVIQIKGKAFCYNESGAFAVSAYNFAYDSGKKISFFVPDVTYESNYSPYPIMTFGSSIPVDTVGIGTVHKIVLQNIGVNTAKALCANGSFAMEIKHGASVKKYLKCFADRCSFSADNLEKGITVTVVSYDTEGEG